MKDPSPTAHARLTLVVEDGAIGTTHLPAAIAAAAALALGACGTAPAPESPEGPIVLSSSATSGTPTPSA